MNQFARTDIRKKSFAVRKIEKWNSLPDWVRAENKLFQRQLKKAMV